MDSTSRDMGLSEAAGCFLADLSADEKKASQQEINRFIRWFGGGRPLTGITAAEIDKYAAGQSLSDTDYLKKLELIRAFLLYIKKKGWSKINLATHLKARKGKTAPKSSARANSAEPIFLTRQGYTEMEAELVSLRDKRSVLIDEIRRAAADKDFRENVPLHAAREQRGHVEGRIMELEEALKLAVIIDEKRAVSLKVNIGDHVVLHDLDSGEELRYTLVSPSEVDPARGKISTASPVGKAIIGKGEGAMVDVAVPAGRMRCRVKQIER